MKEEVENEFKDLMSEGDDLFSPIGPPLPSVVKQGHSEEQKGSWTHSRLRRYDPGIAWRCREGSVGSVWRKLLSTVLMARLHIGYFSPAVSEAHIGLGGYWKSYWLLQMTDHFQLGMLSKMLMVSIKMLGVTIMPQE